MNNDLISRAAAIEAICGCFNIMDAQGVDMAVARGIVKSVLDNAPAVDTVPVRHGHWIDRDGQYECSECHNISCCRANYCPDCGALMNGGEQNATDRR